MRELTPRPVSKPEVRVNVRTIVDDYLDGGDYQKENANQSVTPNGLLFSVGCAGLNRDYIARMREAGHGELASLHDAGAVHIHDLGLGYCTPYCIGLSMQSLIDNGIPVGAVPAKPPKHFRTVINQMINMIGATCNEVAGAIAYNDIDLYLGAYAYKHYLEMKASGVQKNTAFRLTRREIKQSLQELVFHLNQTNRWGGQSPFSNATLAMSPPEDMVDREAVIGGKPLRDCYSFEEDGINVRHHTYGDLREWQRLVCDILLDLLIEGSAEDGVFTFPVMTINATKEFLYDEEFEGVRKKVYKLTAKYGSPFFQNFNAGVSGGKRLNPKDVRSMCCRLSLDLEDLRGHTGGLFGNGDSTGSLQVVTVSLPYLAAHAVRECGGNLAEARSYFLETLTRVQELIKDQQLWKREVVDEFYKRGFFPHVRANLGQRGFKTFFTTHGFVGVHEAVSILRGDEMGFMDDEGMALACGIEEKMKENVDRFIEETGTLFNLEATPAESAAYKLAKKALKEFPDIYHQGLKKAPYFTNSCHLPVDEQHDLGLIFTTQSKLQTIPSGGTVTHFYIEEDMSAEEVETAVRTVCNTPIPFFSLSMIFSVCPICGRIAGQHEVCPNEHTPEQIEELRAKRPELVEG